MSFGMDVMSFLKLVPAVIGIAGFLTYFMRARGPDSEDQLVSVVQNTAQHFFAPRLRGLDPAELVAHLRT